MRILIIRHGDPDYENDTLTEKGHREASLLAEKLKHEKMYDNSATECMICMNYLYDTK